MSSIIYITFDGDDAGKKAALRCGYILATNSLEPKIITPPDEMDPDDWISKKGKEEFDAALNNANDIIKSHYNYFSNYEYVLSKIDNPNDNDVFQENNFPKEAENHNEDIDPQEIANAELIADSNMEDIIPSQAQDEQSNVESLITNPEDKDTS